MVKTRTIQQVLIHKLVMNPMRGNTENSQLVAWSDDKDKLVNFYNNEKVESYTNEGSPSFECHGDSHKWYKSFKLGGILEWYNPIDSFEHPNRYGQGIQQEWVDLEILPNISVGFRVW
jgi:hypothetical protein